MNNFVILIPSFNDWDSLNVLIPKIHNVIKDLNKDISIIIINDSSTIKKKIIFKNKLCFNKIEILNLLENVKAQKAVATALYYLKKKNYNGGIITMDADGQDDPAKLPEIIAHAVKNPKTILTVNRLQREDSLLFKLLYEMHLLMVYIFTFKNLRFGVYSYIHTTHLDKILSNNDLCNAFAASIARNFKNKNIIYVDRKKRLLGESRNSYLNLVYYSLSILSVFRYRVLIHSFILILILFLMSNIKIFSLFVLAGFVVLSIFNLSIFLISIKNNKFNLNNSLNNIGNIENLTHGPSHIQASHRK
jgi:polyisoprenyl-phosphate glycosyltransferase